MAFNAGALLIEADTEVELTDSISTVALADAAISAASQSNSWTNAEGAEFARMRLNIPDFDVSPSANGALVFIYARALNINGADDAPEPTTAYREKEVGAFVIKNVDTEQDVLTTIRLPDAEAGQEYQFYLGNETGAQIAALWQLWIKPRAYNQKSA